MAILVTVIGAVNVFLYDLIRAHGMPLVISVLSFGLATAVESVILGRWQHLSPPARGKGRGKKYITYRRSLHATRCASTK